MSEVSTAWLLFTTLIAASALMTLVWGIAWSIRNLGIVDVAWSLSFGLFAVYFAWAGGAAPERKILAGLMLGIWSLRLGGYLWLRIARAHPEEDSRYVTLRAEWQGKLASRSFLFFQLQAASIVVLIAPFASIMNDPTSRLKPVEWMAAALWIVALAGESISDRQMSRFRNDPLNRGKVCSRGLWRFSRHPNYFFESLVWWSFFLLSLGQEYGWLAIYQPVSMLWLLLKVTGVPMSEAQSLKSRGDDYRAYQTRTSKFIPWFQKR